VDLLQLGLRRWEEGRDVELLKADGIFGSHTTQSVRRCQRAHRIPRFYFGFFFWFFLK
jgi:peptidoglycan hydrolase-like protein with peptidoglycan-binding domain